MKAIVFTQYGSPDVLRLTEIDKPTPTDSQVLVKIYACSVKFGDTLVRNFGSITPREFSMPSPMWLPARLYFGWRKPKKPLIPGGEFAGKVEAVGKNVTRFKVGDEVFGYRGQSLGANVEYLSVEETSIIAPKPNNMTYEEAATVPYGALTALNLLRKANIQRGQKVLINGASGGIGSYALQLAKHYGAHVTGVCGTARMEFVRSLGADQVIDYTKTDFTQTGAQYDLIFDVQGKASFARCKKAMTSQGRILYASFKLKQVFQMMRTSRGSGQKVICALSGEMPDDLRQVLEMVEAGEIKTFVDRCYPLEQAADAHRYMESRDRAGNVVLVMAQ